MNPSTLIGMVASVLLLVVVMIFAAEDPLLFIDLPGLAIVLVGTMAATFMSYPLKEVLRVFKLIKTVIRNERLYTQKDIEELVDVSRLWIREDPVAVEKALQRVTNPFLRTGVQLVIERTPEEDILDLLQWRISRLRAQEAAEAQLFRVMALTGLGYAIFAIVSFAYDPMIVLWRVKEAYLTNLTGTFVNRNTAATFFGTISVLWLMALLSDIRFGASRRLRWSERLWLLSRGRDLGTLVLALGLLVNVAAFQLLQGADRENLNVRGAAIHYEVFGDRGPWVALSPGGRRAIAAYAGRATLHVESDDGTVSVGGWGATVEVCEATRITVESVE